MTKNKEETKEASFDGSKILFDLMYKTNDLREEVRSISAFLKNAYTIDHAIPGEELVGFGLILERVANEMKEVRDEIEKVEMKYPKSERLA